jgi:predicted phosphodiesterase
VTGAFGKAKNDQYTATHKDIYKGLPKGRHNDYSAHILPAGKYGIMSDIHIPAHDDVAVGITLEYFYKQNVKHLILNGDILDCYQVSDHVRDPTEPQLRAELDALKPWLKFLLTKFKTITYKLGNHEERLERFLLQRAPQLYGWEILSWSNMIGIPEIPIIENKRIVKAGKLAIVHGHEFGRQQVFNPVNPARGYFLRSKANVLGGDKHQTSEHVESDINGKILGAWSTGCLCDLHPKYLPINRWNLGAATVEHDGEDFEVHNFKIINGKIK